MDVATFDEVENVPWNNRPAASVLKEADPLPIRLVSRLTTELAVMNLQQSMLLVPGRLETSIVAQAVIRCALPLMAGSDRVTLPPDAPLVASIGSVARSFERSPETIRRHVHALARHGFFTVEQDGIRLTPHQEPGRRIVAYLQSAHDNLLWLIEELHSWKLLTRRPPRSKIAPLHRILRTSLDLRLLGFETFRGPLHGWTSLVLWNALSAISVRHITSDRRLSASFVSRSTPDSLRRPTTVRTLSTLSRLPYATVWRHLAALEAAGKVARRNDGYVLLTDQLLSTEIETRVAQYVRDTLSRVESLIGEGLDPNEMTCSYINGRPTLAPIR